jgi:hypothetical protein
MKLCEISKQIYYFLRRTKRECVNFVNTELRKFAKLALYREKFCEHPTSGQDGAGPGVPWDHGSLVSPAVQREGVQIRGEA